MRRKANTLLSDSSSSKASTISPLEHELNSDHPSTVESAQCDRSPPEQILSLSPHCLHEETYLSGGEEEEEEHGKSSHPRWTSSVVVSIAVSLPLDSASAPGGSEEPDAIQGVPQLARLSSGARKCRDEHHSCRKETLGSARRKQTEGFPKP